MEQGTRRRHVAGERARSRQVVRQKDHVARVGVALAGLSAIAALVATAVTAHQTNRSLRLAERGQMTERFGQATAQLGSSALDVRLGGIYSLERVMKDSRDDEATVLDVLTAFVRNRLPVDGRAAKSARTGEVPTTRPPALPADIRAVLTVLSRRPDPAQHRVDLSRTNFASRFLDSVNFADFDLSGSLFDGSELWNVDFSRATLRQAHLRSATSMVTNKFDAADLSRASLQNAQLGGSTFKGANLNGTILIGSDLRASDLSTSDVACTLTDLGTVLPDGVSPPLPWESCTTGADGRGRPGPPPSYREVVPGCPPELILAGSVRPGGWQGDVVRFKGGHYFAVGRALDTADVGRVVGKTRCDLSSYLVDPRYSLRDGDAGALPPGTVLRQFGREPLSSYLVAVKKQSLVLYKRDPAAG